MHIAHAASVMFSQFFVLPSVHKGGGESGQMHYLANVPGHEHFLAKDPPPPSGHEHYLANVPGHFLAYKCEVRNRSTISFFI